LVSKHERVGSGGGGGGRVGEQAPSQLEHSVAEWRQFGGQSAGDVAGRAGQLSGAGVRGASAHKRYG